MNTEITKPNALNALNALALRVQCDPDELIKTLKQTVFKGASDAEFNALVIISNTYELNPILKELYAFPAKGGGIVPVVGIDGWLKIINRQANFNGMTTETSADGQSATTTIHVKGRDHPSVVTEYLAECSRGTEPWKTMPRRMLRHKSIIQCARVAFGIGGVQDEDEATDAAMRDVTPGKTSPAKLETPNIPGKRIEAQEEKKEASQDERPPTGKQQKERYIVDVNFQSISEKSSNGKTWFEVSAIFTKNGKRKSVAFTTFSTTHAGALRQIDKGTLIKATVVETKPGENFALESYEIIEEEGLV